jgi:hypothetical protein
VPNLTGREGTFEAYCPPHDRFFRQGTYLRTHAEHMQRWPGRPQER